LIRWYFWEKTPGPLPQIGFSTAQRPAAFQIFNRSHRVALPSIERTTRRPTAIKTTAPIDFQRLRGFERDTKARPMANNAARALKRIKVAVTNTQTTDRHLAWRWVIEASPRKSAKAAKCFGFGNPVQCAGSWGALNDWTHIQAHRRAPTARKRERNLLGSGWDQR